MEITLVVYTKNVASRLEDLTRTLNVPMVVSAELMAAVGRENVASPAELTGLETGGEHALRGRKNPVSIWTLRRTARAAFSPSSPLVAQFTQLDEDLLG
jgi:adenylate cyclase